MKPLNRREFSLLLPQMLLVSACARPSGERLPDQLADLEQRVGGRLGVAVYEPGSGMESGYRLDERFGRLAPDQFVTYTEADMVPYAPVTTPNLEHGGMRLIDLAETVQVTSDNVAANLLIDLLGGPEGFTQALRDIGDPTTRLDRYEPDMNFVPQGEARDTTTPRAMAKTTAALVLGDVLQEASRQLLVDWMRATRTGSRRLRAGLPDDWQPGDKTGTAYAKGMANKTND